MRIYHEHYKGESHNNYVIEKKQASFAEPKG